MSTTGYKATFCFLGVCWGFLILLPAEGTSQEFDSYASFAPYKGNQTLTFQTVPPFDERELRTYSALPDPQFDALTPYREDAYRAFGAMGQPNVQVRQYAEKKFSNFNTMTTIGSQRFKTFSETPYTSFSPFDGFQE